MGRSWRRWATPITLILLLVVLGWGLWWGWEQLTRPPQIVPPPPCVTQSASVLNSSQVTVQVFNGGQISGLAGQVTEQLKNKGFVTRSPTNTSEAVGVTVVVGGVADSPAVQLVLGFFPGAEVRADGRTDGTVDVLVGNDFAGFNDGAPTEIGVPGGTVCIPGANVPTPQNPQVEGEPPQEPPATAG